MTPAFTVGYIDRLDKLFQKPLRDMLDIHQSQLASGQQSIPTNLMDDLHRIALEM